MPTAVVSEGRSQVTVAGPVASSLSRLVLTVPTVERRRRDKINNWIVQLSKIIPDCSMESTKSGQVREGSWCWAGAGVLSPVGAPGSRPSFSLRFPQGEGGSECELFRKAR